jgi:hypothetical protein
MSGKTKGGKSMAYTPELSYESSCTLRRIAWAMKMPMTKAMEEIFSYLPKIVDKKKICAGCRDKSGCEECVFKPTEKGESDEQEYDHAG